MSYEKCVRNEGPPMTTDSVTYDDSTGRYHAEFALDGPNSVPDAVVFALAEITDRDPVELSPLGDVVDTDALGAIFRPAAESDSHVSVTFEYQGYLVTVHDTGTISFEESERANHR